MKPIIETIKAKNIQLNQIKAMTYSNVPGTLRCFLLDLLEYPGIGTATNGYSVEQFNALIESCIMPGTTGIRDRSMFLSMHYGIFRCQSVRYMELSHLQVHDLQNQGPSRCMALVYILHPKKKQTG